MNLAGFQIAPVLRDKWEAVDLGIALARRWYGWLVLSWLLPAVLVFVPLMLIFSERSWIACMLVWWLKPLFDRFPLFFVSRYIFGEDASWRDSRKELFAGLGFSLFSALTWRRFDFQRSFNLAVTVLERQKGKARADRCGLLDRRTGGAAIWLTVVMIHLEAVLCFSLAALVFWFIPDNIDFDFLDSYYSAPFLFEILYSVFYFVGVVLIAPFYVACGFSLYLTRRIELEAWDLEIAFRQSVHQRAKIKKQREINSGFSSALLMLVICVFALFSPPESVALDAGAEHGEIAPTINTEAQAYYVEPDSSRAQSKTEIQTILQSPPFIIEEEQSYWSFKEAEYEGEESVPRWVIWLIKALEKIFGINGLTENIAPILEVSIWVFIVILVVAIVYRFRSYLLKHLSSLINRKNTPQEFEKPEVIMGMEITEDSLPDDIPGAAKQFWERGQIRQALALLYRGSLYELVYTHQLELAEWYTERECCAMVTNSSNQRLARYFLQLTTTWQKLAYAHRQPEQDLFDALCQNWGEALQHG